LATRKPVSIPADTWPPRMMADLAAGYCGEKHVEDFLERVGSTYPEPRIVDSSRRKFWYRADLDRAMRIGATGESNGMGERLLAKVREKRRG
jgi:hypothetical protein